MKSCSAKAKRTSPSSSPPPISSDSAATCGKRSAGIETPVLVEPVEVVPAACSQPLREEAALVDVVDDELGQQVDDHRRVPSVDAAREQDGEEPVGEAHRVLAGGDVREMIGLMLTMSLYLQLGQGFSAIHTGLTFAPWAIGTGIGAGIGAGALGPKIGRPVLHVGLAVMAVGVAGTLLVVHGAGDAGVSSWALAGPQLVAGIGMGAVLAPLFGFVLAGVRDHEVGSASGVLNAVQQLAGALGIAVIGTIFFSVATKHGMTAAFQDALWIELGLLVVAAVLVAALPMRMRPEEDLLA